MLLLGLLLLTSALAGRRQGAVAESDLSSKFAFSGAKEQNGKEPQRPPLRSPGQGGGGRPAGAERSSPLGSAPLLLAPLLSAPVLWAPLLPPRGGSAAPRAVGAGAARLCRGLRVKGQRLGGRGGSPAAPSSAALEVQNVSPSSPPPCPAIKTNKLKNSNLNPTTTRAPLYPKCFALGGCVFVSARE